MHRDNAKFRAEIVARQGKETVNLLQVEGKPVQFTAIEDVKKISFDDALALTNYLEVRDEKEPSGWRKLFAQKPIVTGSYLERKNFFEKI